MCCFMFLLCDCISFVRVMLECAFWRQRCLSQCFGAFLICIIVLVTLMLGSAFRKQHIFVVIMLCFVVINFVIYFCCFLVFGWFADWSTEIWAEVRIIWSQVRRCWSQVQTCWSQVRRCWSKVRRCWSQVQKCVFESFDFTSKWTLIMKHRLCV